MKVSFAESHVISSSGLEQHQAFKIRTSAHAFKILSSGLYSDKIGAVLREIGCNAHDAHVSVGKSHVPIEVKLPNSIDPQFWIKDWGPGLSHEEVMNLYTTYFASTKQDSNDFTGAFGLGSKSPFSYTDSFTVTSCHGGMSRIYSAHIDNTGSPNIALMSETELKPSVVSGTEFETGITVSFPVKSQDFVAFKQRAQTIFQYFSPLPNILGSEPIKTLEVEEDFETYAFIDEDYHRSNLIQMGNVCYPLSISELGTVNQELCNARGLLLRFKLGDVQVAASREQIQYDPVSQERIKTRLREVANQICRNLESKWLTQTASGTWADICKFHELKNSSNRGFNVNATALKKAGVRDPDKLHEALNSYEVELLNPPDTVTCYILQERAGKLLKNKRCIAYTNDITLVYGADSYHYTRVKNAILAKTLIGKILVVVPNKKKKGTLYDMNTMLDKLRAVFMGIPEKKLAEFPAPIIVRSKRLPKGALKSLPQNIESVSDKVYIKRRTRTSWGRTKTWMQLDETTKFGRYEWSQLTGYIEKTKPVVSFALPIPLSETEIKRFKMTKRTDWKDYKAYMTEEMAKPANIAALKKEVGKIKYTVALNTYHNPDNSLIKKLVYLRWREQEAFNAITKILAEYKLLDKIEKIYADSKDPAPKSGAPELLTTYRRIAALLGIKIDVPEFDTPQMELDEKYTSASAVPYTVLMGVWQYTPELFPKFVDTLLEKGST